MTQDMKNIYYSYKKYRIRKLLNGKSCEFGSFPSLEVAIYVRDFLQENGWIIPFSHHTIFEIGGQYHVVMNISSYSTRRGISYLGSASSMTEAEKLADNPLGEKYINPVAGGFVINKTKNKKVHTFGYFKDHEVAYAMRDYIISCEWQLPTHNNEYIVYIKEQYYLIRIDDGNIKVIDRNKKKNKINDNDMSNIYKTSEGFSISRLVDKTRENYRTYRTVEEAKSMRKFLREHQWDKKLFEEEYNKRYPTLPEYVYKEGERYCVRRKWKGLFKSYGKYNTLPEAINRVKYLEKHNWVELGGLNLVNYDGVFYIYKNMVTGYSTPIRKYYYQSEHKENALAVLEKFRTEGFPEPFLITNKYRYIVRNRQLFYLFYKQRKLCYARTMREALVARDICEWLGMKELVPGEYEYDDVEYIVTLNAYGTPVFEKR